MSWNRGMISEPHLKSKIVNGWKTSFDPQASTKPDLKCYIIGRGGRKLIMRSQLDSHHPNWVKVTLSLFHRFILCVMVLLSVARTLCTDIKAAFYEFVRLSLKFGPESYSTWILNVYSSATIAHNNRFVIHIFQHHEFYEGPASHLLLWLSLK